MYHTQNVWKLPVVVQNSEIKEIPDIPWYRKGIKIGVSVPSSILKQLPGLQKVQKPTLNSNGLRQLTAGHIHTTGSNIGGYYALADIGAVWLYKDPRDANKWAKQIDHNLAPSLTLIDSGQENVRLVLSCRKKTHEKIELYLVVDYKKVRVGSAACSTV